MAGETKTADESNSSSTNERSGQPSGEASVPDAHRAIPTRPTNETMAKANSDGSVWTGDLGARVNEDSD
jgi:hypothetical protein